MKISSICLASLILTGSFAFADGSSLAQYAGNYHSEATYAVDNNSCDEKDHVEVSGNLLTWTSICDGDTSTADTTVFQCDGSICTVDLAFATDAASGVKLLLLNDGNIVLSNPERGVSYKVFRIDQNR